MTTAHRPTFHTAIGGKEQGGGRYIAGVSRTHVHDQRSQLSLKVRAPGQGTAAEVASSKATMREALEAKEAKHLEAIGRAPAFPSLTARAPPPLPPPEDDLDDDDEHALIIDPDDADDRPGKGQAAPSRVDSDEDDEDDDEDDEDDEAELMRELERIKKERAQEAARKAREEQEEAAAEHDSAVLQSNPLLDPSRLGASGSGKSFAVKRRWDDDVVFKNQAREPKQEERRFINDTVRNDFHRRFLNKYVK